MKPATRELVVLKEQCRRWGGDLYRYRYDSFPGRDSVYSTEWEEAPFFATDSRYVSAIHYKHKLIGVTDSVTQWHNVIHEMGHVFASRLPVYSLHPGNDEFHFLGWEICLVRHLGFDFKRWLKVNGDYGISYDHVDDAAPNGGQYFGALADLRHHPKALDAFVADRINVAKKRGLVSSSGIPQSVR